MLLSKTQKITSVGALMDKMNLCALSLGLQNVAATVGQQYGDSSKN